MNDQLFAEGRCNCGDIALFIRGKPKMMVQCHCLDCQKVTGTGHTSNAYFDRNDVTIRGEASSHTVMADSGNEMSRYFCPTCGSRVYGYNSGRPELISIQVGCLDDNSWFTPQVVLFASRRHDWDITNEEIPNYDKMIED
jgi:hypothetical protein